MVSQITSNFWSSILQYLITDCRTYVEVTWWFRHVGDHTIMVKSFKVLIRHILWMVHMILRSMIVSCSLISVIMLWSKAWCCMIHHFNHSIQSLQSFSTEESMGHDDIFSDLLYFVIDDISAACFMILNFCFVDHRYHVLWFIISCFMINNIMVCDWQHLVSWFIESFRDSRFHTPWSIDWWFWMLLIY